MKSKLVVLSVCLTTLLGLVLYQQAAFSDGKLHLVFCDVGQGDAIFVRTPLGSDILVDGGPNDKVLDCISRHMPFWDRTLDLVILSHPHEDHIFGLLGVFERYRVRAFATEKLTNDTVDFRKLLSEVKREGLSVQYLYAGDQFKTKDNVILKIVGPSREFLEKTSPGGAIGESREFGSVETLVAYGAFAALLTGDSQADELHDALESGLIRDISVLQVPHHGSRTGLTQEILDALAPRLAVISVGANNRYRHPNPLTLSLLEKNHIEVKRTDKYGAVEIISDGKNFKLE